MKLPKNARVIAGGAALAVAFLAGIALAPSVVAPAAAHLLGGNAQATTANRGPNGTDLFSAAAQYIGITTDQLRTEMGTDKSMADVAVAHGKTRDGLLQALTTAAQQKLAQRITDLVDHKGAPQRGKGPGFGFGGVFFKGNELQTASTYLGVSTSDLQTKLQSGQTLAQIANATSGKSADGLIQAIVQDETTKIDQAVSSGKITADQATKIKSGLTQMVTNMVNNTHPRPGPGMGFGHRGPFGPQPSPTPAAGQ